MSTFQQSQHPNIIFRGIDGIECEEFVAALEDLAYAEGWTEDRRRMLFFARSRLRNAALRWFAQLDPSVKDNWDLFLQALFEQYPPVMNPPNSSEVGIATPIWSATTFSPTLSTATLSAKPRLSSAEGDEQREWTDQALSGSGHPAVKSSLRSYDSSRPGLHVGRLRIVYEQETPPAYVWRGEVAQRFSTATNNYFVNGGRLKCVTFNRQDALLVSFCSDSEPNIIACPEASQDQGDLAVVLESEFAEFHPLVSASGPSPSPLPVPPPPAPVLVPQPQPPSRRNTRHMPGGYGDDEKDRPDNENDYNDFMPHPERASVAKKKKMCINCQTNPSFGKSEFCSKPCKTEADSKLRSSQGSGVGRQATSGGWARTAFEVSSSGRSSMDPYYQVVSKIWNVLADGTLQATLSDFPEPTRDERGYRSGQVKPSNWTATAVYVDPSGVPLLFAKDYATPNSLHADSNRPMLKARIVFEPL